jgi:hypothetical protein
MHQAAERGAECGGDAGTSAFRKRARDDIENAGAGNGRDNQGCDKKEGEISRQRH